MILKQIELSKFDIHGLYEATDSGFFSTINFNGCSNSYMYMNDEYPKDQIKEMLSSGLGVYYSFAIRDGKNLECANGESLIIREGRSGVGVDMGDAYIREDDCINLGFLVSCTNDILTFKAAIEGEAAMFTKCVVIDNCGELEEDMKEFLNRFEL